MFQINRSRVRLFATLSHMMVYICTGVFQIILREINLTTQGQFKSVLLDFNICNMTTILNVSTVVAFFLN